MDIDVIKWRKVAIHLQIDPNHIYKLLRGEEHGIEDDKLREIISYVNPISESISNFINDAITNKKP